MMLMMALSQQLLATHRRKTNTEMLIIIDIIYAQED
jgi:hypothetical protein